MSGSYLLPHDATSPKAHWKLHQVLYDGGESREDDARWAAAEGEWDGKRVLALRWNGSAKTPAGNPNSRGYGTWFIIPDELADALRARLPNFPRSESEEE